VTLSPSTWLYILQQSTNCLYNWAKPLPQRVLCHGLPLWISMSWKSWPFKSPEPISAQATRMNLFAFVRTLWENIPNPVKMMGKRPKSRENHGKTPQTPWFVIILHMSYEKKWLLQWLLKHGLEATIKDPGRNPCSFYAARVKVWWMDGVFFLSSHYDSGFTVYI